MQIEQFICLKDNYGVLIHDKKNNVTTAIDAPDAEALLAALERRQWSLDYVFVTHHHADHIDGLKQLKEKTNASIIGPEAEKDKIPFLDKTVKGGQNFYFGFDTVHVIATPGHTLGHVCYYFQKSGILFAGDTLFSLGCGRLFEGTPAMMFDSLKKLRALPTETKIYCGHEYTLANAHFSLTIDPTNKILQKRAQEVQELRAKNQLTLPSTLGQEKATNPFLRWDDIKIRQHLQMNNASDEKVFTAIRRLKDDFK